MTASLEHTNMTVTNPDATAAWMTDVFGWEIRWSGDAIAGGRSVHIGTGGQYLALYAPPTAPDIAPAKLGFIGGLNHLGLVVPDLDATEARVKAAGFETYSHASYEPGRRFYFNDHDGIEFEVVSYP